MKERKIIYPLLLVMVFLTSCGQGKMPAETLERPVEKVTKKEEAPPLEDKNKRKKVASKTAANQILLKDEEVKTGTDATHEDRSYNKAKDTINLEFFTQINDYDSLGRPYIRWIEFRDTSSGQLLGKIDVIEKDNPYFQAGLKINCVDENGPQIYYTLGEQADKNMVRPFLPEEQYKAVADDYLYPMALSMVIVTKVGNYLIVNYSFEWGGLEREWIRGEYIGHAVMVYDQKGNLKYSNINTPGELSYISPSGDYLFFIENKYHDDWEKQTGCLSIYYRPELEFSFRDCQLHSGWYRAMNPSWSNNPKKLLFDTYESWGVAHRDKKYSNKIVLFNPVQETLYKIEKKPFERIKKIQDRMFIVNIDNNEKRIININNFEILNKE